MNASWREACIAHVRTASFGLGTTRTDGERMGAEVELIPVDAATRRVAPIEHPTAPSSMTALRGVAARQGWAEHRSRKTGQPEFTTGAGGRISFEPGGQVEYASPPLRSVSELADDLRRVVTAVRDGLLRHGLDAVFSGIDPVNAIEFVPLQGDALRYRRMDAHFAAIGPHGARMMRQTASIQVNVDLGGAPLDRWRLLNAIAPYLAAMFANAPGYEGRLTGHASVRRLAWCRLDPDRTGLAFDGTDPAGAYTDFGFRAADLLGAEAEPPFPAFGWRSPEAGLGAWTSHLTTLFPEVRPRGYFEVRSTDALDPAWVAVPLVMIAGLTRSTSAAAAALEVAGPPEPGLLEPAGRLGLRHPVLGAGAEALSRLALRGAESLGPGVVSTAELQLAEAFFDRFTWRGETPADSVRADGVRAAAPRAAAPVPPLRPERASA